MCPQFRYIHLTLFNGMRLAAPLPKYCLTDSSFFQAVKYDVEIYPNVKRWLEKTIGSFPEADYKDGNADGVEAYRKFYFSRTTPKTISH